jgi:hypothetical protein
MSGALQDSAVLDGLIGRVALNAFDIHYNGKTGRVTLRYLGPPK